MSRRGTLGLVAALAVVTAGLAAPAANATTSGTVVTTKDAAPNSYVVVLKGAAGRAGVNAVKATATATSVTSGVHGAVVTHVYSAALNGFSVHVDAAGAAQLAKDSRVQAVYQDGVVHLDSVEGTDPRVLTLGQSRVNTAEPVPAAPSWWGLDAIDQHGAAVTDGKYNYALTGAGVKAYVIDSGIRSTHTQFTGRILPGYSVVNDGLGTEDALGHGTHVAGIIGGSTVGVAKAVKLVPVRVFDSSGSALDSTIIAGIDWVTAHHGSGPAVANMSFGGSYYTPLDISVNNLIESGVTVAVAAGNGGGYDACYSSPSGLLSAITVGATGWYENPSAPASRNRSSYSDVGPCVDVWAPGSNILSAWNTGDSDGTVLSGTSMATPHVVGVAALYLQSVPGANPMQVRNYLVAMSTKNVVGGLGTTGSPNRFLYAGGPSTLTVTAPATVRKNASFTISGKLVAGTTPLAGTVKVYFGSTLKGTLTVNAAGVFSGNFSEAATGKWTVTYAGVPLLGASSVVKTVTAK